ncbi:MAG: hypothetical protein WA580_00410 [Acidimicrobiales bacterium]
MSGAVGRGDAVVVVVVGRVVVVVELVDVYDVVVVESACALVTVKRPAPRANATIRGARRRMRENLVRSIALMMTGHPRATHQFGRGKSPKS